MTDALTSARQRRDDVRRAAEGLERAVATAAGAPNWAVGVRARLSELRDAFREHIAVTEGPDGLFVEIMATAPRLGHRIEALCREHTEIGNLVASLLDHTESVAEGDAERLRRDLIDLLARITWHRHLGAELVYEAYTVDIEAGD